LTILLSLLFLKGSFLNFIDKSGSVIKVTFKGIIGDKGGEGVELIEKLLPLSAFMILIPALSLVTILLFKNRKIQLWFSLSLIIIVVGLIIISILYSSIVITQYDANIIPGFKIIIPVMLLVFALLAYRGIRKDDRLIKSFDRLR
jgi:peptidoglycan/LPS O-acetylase OafA/YrhL